MDLILNPWPWYVAGPLITLVMVTLIYFGKDFGFSNNLRTMCAVGGAGRISDFFKIDWKRQRWNLMFVVGSVIGGLISYKFLTKSTEVDLATNTQEKLTALGFLQPGSDYLPSEIFGVEALSSWQGLAILLIGGFLVGFGARYAGGCTSGHAISGLSNLQLPSLIAVIGFFIGGLSMVHFILPLIF